MTTRLFALLVLVVTLTLLAGSAAAGREIAGVAPEALLWNHYHVGDAPKSFSGMDDHSLRLDAAGHPHIAYGQDHLYYAWFDGSSWQFETADASWGVGGYASLALDNASNAHISYYDAIYSTVKYARRAADGQWAIQTVAASSEYDPDSSIAVDAAGRPHIAFHGPDDTLQYAYWTGSTWAIQVVETYAGDHNSLVLDSSGNPHIAYSYAASYLDTALHYAHWTGSAWDIQVVEQNTLHVSPAGDPSIALDGAGSPHVSYYAVYDSGWDGYLRYATLSGSQWIIETVLANVGVVDTSLALDGGGHPHISFYAGYPDYTLCYASQPTDNWQVQTVDTQAGWDSSLVVDGAGNVTISYAGSTVLKVATRNAGRSAQAAWVIQQVDIGGQEGQYTAIALDSTDHPHISYYDVANQDLEYTHWDGTAREVAVVDGAGDVGQYGDIALDGAGHPHISYYDSANSALRYAHWTGTAWLTETLESGTVQGEDTGIAVDGSGNPHISYVTYDGNTYLLRYAHQVGGVWQYETLDSNSEPKHTSLALDTAGHPHISYFDWNTDCVKFLRWNGSLWESGPSVSADEGDTAIAVDGSGGVHIAFFQQGLQYLFWPGSGMPTVQLIDAEGYDHTSLALDSASQPHITYFDNAFDLRYVRWAGGNWENYRVDSPGRVGEYNSLALSSDGTPHISYYDDTNGDLCYATGSAAGYTVYLPMVARRR
jgi:hypothetical protein